MASEVSELLLDVALAPPSAASAAAPESNGSRRRDRDCMEPPLPLLRREEQRLSAAAASGEVSPLSGAVSGRPPSTSMAMERCETCRR